MSTRPLTLLPFLLLATVPLGAQELPRVRPTVGLVITRNVRLIPGVYRLPARSDSAPVITIRGTGIVVDMRGVTLEGSAPTVDPDLRSGLAILIDGGAQVTVRNGRIRGYQTGIRAVGTTDLTLLGNDLSDNWKPRLFSIVEHESLIDWLSYHKNENNEWRRFGAGVALEGVHRGVLQDNIVRRGMNGVLMTRTDSVQIEENDFSFNSGLGIGLYRSTDNLIVRNRVDYNVRGFSRYYRRGQDSADLLMFEQSSRNTVAFNSMTHGGDGLFLWAGQHTMDTGEGGSNDNLFLGNDFSYAPTNGMEATFSRNDFIANRIVGSDHGLWGGYSFRSTVDGNCFALNRIGIAIEHGQENVVTQNVFDSDSTAVFLWADPIQPSDWGYPKHRDTRSHDWRFEGNQFIGHRVGLRIRQTSLLTEIRDYFRGVDTLAAMRDTADFTLDLQRRERSGEGAECVAMPQIPDEFHHRGPFGPVALTDLALRPRDAIIVDEWGPYDWTTPRLWPVDSSLSSPLKLVVIGPAEPWRLRWMRGVASISRRFGFVGDTIVVTPTPGATVDWGIELGPQEGHTGRRFSYSRFDPIPGWDATFFTWSDSAGRVTTPLFTRREPRLDFMWYRPQDATIPAERWGLEATTMVDLGPGKYTLRTISDDAIQVWVDGQLVIDHDTPHESLVDNAPIAAGRHDIRVRYRQVTGWVELKVEIVRGTVTSTGSPGPH